MKYLVKLKRYGLLLVAKFDTLEEAEAYTKHDTSLYLIEEVEDEES